MDVKRTTLRRLPARERFDLYRGSVEDLLEAEQETLWQLHELQGLRNKARRKQINKERYRLLLEMYSLPFWEKVRLSQLYIEDWYEHWTRERGQEMSVSYSGGMDSTVLLHLVRQSYGQTLGYFVDTGLEYPEIRKFARDTPGVRVVRPRMPFRRVLEHHGYPVVTKEVSQFIKEARRPRDTPTKRLRLTGYTEPGAEYRSRHRIPQKHLPLLDAPFKISEMCCEELKKKPLKQIPNPLVGTRAEESSVRVQSFIKYGVNSYGLKKPKAQPLMFWSEVDIWEYVDEFELEYASCYEGDDAVSRTGCMFCMFGQHDLPPGAPSKFQSMAKTHPKHYDYCINRIPIGERRGLRDVLDYMQIPYKPEGDDV